MSKGLWHFIVIALLLLIAAGVGYVAWRIYRMRHPLVVYVPPAEPIANIEAQMTEIVDVNIHTREHVASAADSFGHHSKLTNHRLSLIESMLRKIAKAFGVSTDEFH